GGRDAHQRSKGGADLLAFPRSVQGLPVIRGEVLVDAIENFFARSGVVPQNHDVLEIHSEKHRRLRQRIALAVEVLLQGVPCKCFIFELCRHLVQDDDADRRVWFLAVEFGGGTDRNRRGGYSSWPDRWFKRKNSLRNFILVNLEVISRQVGNRLALLVIDNHIEYDDLRVDLEGVGARLLCCLDRRCLLCVAGDSDDRNGGG